MRGQPVAGDQAVQLCRMWRAGDDARVIADAIHVPIGRVYATARRLGLPPRPRRMPGRPVQPPDPTPEEIAAMCHILKQQHYAERRRLG
jgi:hypothetical protein